MIGAPQHRLDPALIDRFNRDLDALVEPNARLGVAVSGGPDSLALLLLANAARPNQVEAATVDHQLRAESRSEAHFVAHVCARLGIPHKVLTLSWPEKPATAIQERARAGRYAALSKWAFEHRLDAILTGHQRDDQIETLLMRLARGSGVGGLAAIRPATVLPGESVRLIRPLLGWSHADLVDICAAAALTPIDDPSNHDSHFERVRLRKALEQTAGLDAGAIAASAAHLAEADEALTWAAEVEWARSVQVEATTIKYMATDAPAEIRRRIVCRAILILAKEGEANPLRGPEIDRLLLAMSAGGTATLRGVRCSGGSIWRFSPAPQRRF